MFDPADLPFNDDQRLVFQRIMHFVESELVFEGNAHAHLSDNLFFLMVRAVQEKPSFSMLY